MTKRTCQFPKHTCLREINFLKIAGISLLLFCTTSQIAVADSYEKNAVTATQQSKTEKITGKIVDESGEAIIGASVKVQGSTIGTITNLEGEFTLSNAPARVYLKSATSDINRWKSLLESPETCASPWKKTPRHWTKSS